MSSKQKKIESLSVKIKEVVRLCGSIDQFTAQYVQKAQMLVGSLNEVSSHRSFLEKYKLINSQIYKLLNAYEDFSVTLEQLALEEYDTALSLVHKSGEHDPTATLFTMYPCSSFSTILDTPTVSSSIHNGSANEDIKKLFLQTTQTECIDNNERNERTSAMFDFGGEKWANQVQEYPLRSSNNSGTFGKSTVVASNICHNLGTASSTTPTALLLDEFQSTEAFASLTASSTTPTALLLDGFQSTEASASVTASATTLKATLLDGFQSTGALTGVTSNTATTITTLSNIAPLRAPSKPKRLCNLSETTRNSQQEKKIEEYNESKFIKKQLSKDQTKLQKTDNGIQLGTNSLEDPKSNSTYPTSYQSPKNPRKSQETDSSFQIELSEKDVEPKSNYLKCLSSGESEEENEIFETENQIYSSSENNVTKMEESLPVTDIHRNVGDIYEGYLVYTESPSYFFIIPDSSFNEYYSMRMKLSEIKPKQYKYMKIQKCNAERKHIASSIINRYVVVHKADIGTERAEILNWRLKNDDDQVLVYFIDYGSTDLITLDQIEPASCYQDYFKLPSFVEQCHLGGIYPVGTKHDSFSPSNWTDSVNEVFCNLCRTDELVQIKVVRSDGVYPKYSLPVLMFTNNDSDCLNNKLVKLNQAVFLLQPPKRLRSFQNDKEILEDWDPIKENYESVTNDRRIDVDDPNVATMGFTLENESRVCKFFAKYGHCYKKFGCTKEHILLDSNYLPIQKEKVTCSAFSYFVKPEINSTYDIKLTTICHINKFYGLINLASDNDEEGEINEETLGMLMEYMNKNETQMKKLLTKPCEGQIVIAKSPEDGVWYRGKITMMDVDDQYEVLLVDNGRSVTISNTNLRDMEPRYMHLPFQAIECLVRKIEPTPDCDLQAGLHYLEEIAERGRTKVTVLDVISFAMGTMTLEVELHDDDYDLSSLLIAMQLAKPKLITRVDCNMRPE